MLYLQKWYWQLLLVAPLIGFISYFSLNGYLAWQVLSYLCLPLFIVFAANRKSRIVVPKFLKYYILYAFYIFIWRLFNNYIGDKGFVKYIFNNYHVYYIMLIAVIYNTNISFQLYTKLNLLIKITLIIALGGVILQFFIPNILIRPEGWTEATGNIFLDRRPSVFTYVSDNDYGVSVLAFFSLLFSILTVSQNRRALIIFSIIIGLYAILTNTRYIMAGFVLVLLQSFLIKGRINNISKVIYFSLILVAVYYVVTNFLGVDINRLAEERLFAEGSVEESSRYGAFLTFAEFFPRTPIFGTGVFITDEIREASSEVRSSQIHVGYLAHLVSYGLVGSILLFGFWFQLAKDLYKKARLTNYYGPVFAFGMFLWFNATAVDYRLMYPGVIIALLYSQYYYVHFISNRNQSQST